MEASPEELLTTLRLLSPLLGVWRGAGVGHYPTIDDFEYEEETRFELHDSYPIIAYEQRTTLVSGEPSHWEYGFFRPTAAGTIEVSNVQDSGRVEVLRGEVLESDVAEGRLVLELASLLLGHDPRLIRTKRVLRISAETLEYEMGMETHTTPQPSFSNHLRARLARVTDT